MILGWGKGSSSALVFQGCDAGRIPCDGRQMRVEQA